MSAGSYIRTMRERANIGLRDLARQVGIAPATLSRFEREDDRFLGEEKIVALARALDLEPDALLTSAGRIPSDVRRILILDPDLWNFLRRAKELGLMASDLTHLIRETATVNRLPPQGRA